MIRHIGLLPKPTWAAAQAYLGCGPKPRKGHRPLPLLRFAS